MKIIRAKNIHLNLIVPLFDDYRIFYDQPSDLPRAENFIEQRLKNSDSVIFLMTDEEESEVFGFAQIYPTFSSIATGKIFILNDLYIKPDKRKNGFAGEILHFIKQFARNEGAIKIVLKTARSNHIAQKLYESLGYKKDEEFLNYNLLEL
jgi:RimJ/RimL family protein N-acetyltransferase